MKINTKLGETGVNEPMGNYFYLLSWLIADPVICWPTCLTREGLLAVYMYSNSP